MQSPPLFENDGVKRCCTMCMGPLCALLWHQLAPLPSSPQLMNHLTLLLILLLFGKQAQGVHGLLRPCQPPHSFAVGLPPPSVPPFHFPPPSGTDISAVVAGPSGNMLVGSVTPTGQGRPAPVQPHLLTAPSGLLGVTELVADRRVDGPVGRPPMVDVDFSADQSADHQFGHPQQH